jgi:MEMO1 family protein
MEDIRPSITDTAGWYPKQPKELSERIEMYMRTAVIKSPNEKVIGIIVPHAGHVYSGQIAAYSFNCIRKFRPDIVTIISPSHFIGGADIIISSHKSYNTPLGDVKIDTVILDEIVNLLHNKYGITTKSVQRDPEHSIEVELPFLQHIYDDFNLIPIMIRNQNFEVSKALGNVITEVLQNKKSILIASSDLSHYFNQIVANRLDRELIRRISMLDPEGVLNAEIEGVGQACGIGAIAAVLWASKEQGGSKVDILKYATSGDVTGDYDEVVGYVSAVIT